MSASFIALKWTSISLALIGMIFQTGHQREAQEKFQSLDRIGKMEQIRKWDRFKSLSPELKNTLRDFHQKYSNHPEKAVLKGVMEDYLVWLQGLSPQLRAELQGIDPSKRMDKVRQIWAERRSFRPKLGKYENAELEREDVKVFINWVMPHYRKQFRGWRGRRKNDVRTELQKISDKEFVALSSKLTPKGKDILELNREKRVDLLQFWARSVFNRRPTPQQIIDTYAALSDEAKESLSKKDFEQIHDELRKVFYQKRWADMSGGRSFGEGRSGGRDRGDGRNRRWDGEDEHRNQRRSREGKVQKKDSSKGKGGKGFGPKENSDKRSGQPGKKS